jgi:diaminohydroxyphosphoribosylaminopyrimidine deaminase/5-amino-6-(5-phosphoribosylamino)uracil reductase
MTSEALDTQALDQALAVAEDAIGVSEPNPRVGCVIGSEDGRVFGVGATQQIGGPHAEIVALNKARTAGFEVRGATAWVTLEPCSHHGRTPPCCDALIEAGIARVVVAVEDPFPKVAGAGIARLRASGVQVDMAGPVHQEKAIELNIGYFSRILRGRPWVRLKIAATLDGRTALLDGTSQWITGAEARADGHAWRKRAGAILTGIGTVLADDPRLDVRMVATQVQPLRVVLDSSLRTPTHARLLKSPGRALIVGTQQGTKDAAANLEAAGAEVLILSNDTRRVDLSALMSTLAEYHINELHVEAGANLNAVLLECALVDELLLYQAPVLMGQGLSIAALSQLNDLGSMARFEFTTVSKIGSDLRIMARSATGAKPLLWSSHQNQVFYSH